ncbi:formyltransferase family protein [uncultured Roseobacter sp.]|uniref:methionyl-tRNA formyltransferase n=1 Tax=uncultured Roseobacter sp. TaxID=114847 RepID=UPI00262343E8|nr:formyltransferase family protein [uncultured Roseobacter sp.]
MRMVFVGAVEGSRAALESMCAAGHIPALIVTLPPDLARRHSDFADLDPVAAAHDIPVLYASQINAPEALAAIKDVEPDLALVIGWSQICGPDFRAIPKLGCIGFHPTALPKLRGRGVLPWTILLGERDVGASLFWLGAGADDGPLAAQARFQINPDTVTARELYDRVLEALAGMLPPLLTSIAAGDIPSTPQPDDGISICARRRPEDGRIDWTRPAAEIHRLIRAVGPPYPGAFTYAGDGAQITLTAVRHTPEAGRFIGLPGQIQDINGRSFTVACGDGKCLDILEWSGADKPPPLHSKLKDFGHDP